MKDKLLILPTMKNILTAMFFGFVFLIFSRCANEDNIVPTEGKNPISRLYISTANYRTNQAAAYLNNIFVIDPSDSSQMTHTRDKYTSGALGGRSIYFSAFASRIWQSGMNSGGFVDTTIYTMSLVKPFKDRDSITFKASGTIANRKFTKINAMAYNGLDDQLIVANEGTATSHLYVINSPKSGSGYKRPVYEVSLDYKPQAMYLDSLDLYVSKFGKEGGVVVYRSFVNTVNAKADTVLTVGPTYTLKVAGAQNISGMSFSKAQDLLVMTDFDDAGENGRILIFDKISHARTNTTITPNRIITGSSTLLRKPLNVVVDTRRGGVFLYAVDENSKLVTRFKISDEGNVAPGEKMTVGSISGGNTPMSLSLDTRGDIKVY